MNWHLALFLLLMCSQPARCEISFSSVAAQMILPKGFERLQLGMRLTEFEALRPRAKWWDREISRWFPEKETPDPGPHLRNGLYDEIITEKNFLGDIGYGFKKGILRSTSPIRRARDIEGLIQNRTEVLRGALKLWGKPKAWNIYYEKHLSPQLEFVELIWDVGKHAAQIDLPSNIQRINIDRKMLREEARIGLMFVDEPAEVFYGTKHFLKFKPLGDLKLEGKNVQDAFAEIEFEKLLKEVEQEKDRSNSDPTPKAEKPGKP